mgnify:CR=1 FL=1
MKKIKFLLLLIISVCFLVPKNVSAATISYSSSRWAFGYHTFSSSSDNYYDFTWEALLPIPNPTDRFFVPPKNAGASSYLSFPITAFKFDIIDITLKPDTWYEITVDFGFSNIYTGIFWENATVNSCYVSNVACSNASVRKINNSQIKFTFKPASSGDYLYIDVGKTSDGKNIPELLTNFAEPSLAQYQYFYVSSLTVEPISDVSGELSDLNNTQKETNNKIDKTNDILEDDDVSGANSEASSFFNDFTTTDHGGISSVVKAPLVAFNSMLSNQCTPLTTTWKGQQISLPCGTDFWSQLGELKTFINLTYGGILCYMIAVKLFKLINRLKNPDDDKVEVMDL